jgi:hypothetical protein
VEEVRERFHRAVELPSEERSGYLEQSCAGDDSLKRLVESLLKAEHESDSPGVVSVGKSDRV